MPSEEWAQAIVRVGNGRGFVVKTESEHLVITAGHCLPQLPPRTSSSFTEERTYPRFLGQIGEDPTVSAECVFVDPIIDLAVLGLPDGQEFDTLIEAVSPLPISLGPAQAESEAWLLSLDCRWFSCKVESFGRCLWVKDAAEPIRGGMSGSPIVAPDGSAIGVLVTSNVTQGSSEGGPNPLLMDNLPGWLLREIVDANDR